MKNRCVSCGADLAGKPSYPALRAPRHNRICRECCTVDLTEMRETCCYCGKRDPAEVRERIFRDKYGIPFAIGFFCAECKPVPRED